MMGCCSFSCSLIVNFLWVLQVLRFAVHLGLVMQGDMSKAVIQSALVQRPRCTLAFAAMLFRGFEERTFQLGVLRRVSAMSAAAGQPPAQRAAVLAAYLGGDAALDFLTPSAAIDHPQACADALVLLRRAAELSGQEINWDLDATCARHLAAIGPLVARFAERAYMTCINKTIVKLAGDFLLALADASQLVQQWNLFRPLLAALRVINQLPWDQRSQDVYSIAIHKIAGLRPLI